MLTRVITGVVLAPLLVALLLFGPASLIVAVLTIAGWLCARELLAMSASLRPAQRHIAAALCAGITASPMAGPHAWLLAAACSPVVLLTVPLWRLTDVESGSRQSSAMTLTAAYVGMMTASMTAVVLMVAPGWAADIPYAFGPSALLTLFAIVFAGDTGAYFAGRFFGKNKLYPMVSPQKTVEGTIGGLVASVLAGTLCARGLLGVADADLWRWALAALVTGAVAQVGDLAESLFKRASGTKDSGNLLPGHGGMLDRLDGVLFGAPVFWAWLQLLP